MLAFHNQRGAAGRHMKEGKYALKWTRLSCRRFAANVVRLQRRALACNLANFPRTLATPEGIERWSPTSLRERLVKTDARMARQARHAISHITGVACPGPSSRASLPHQRLARAACRGGFHMTGTAAAGLSVRSAADAKGVTGAGQDRVPRRIAPADGTFRRPGIGQHARRTGTLCLDRRPHQRHSQWRPFKGRIPT